jgi:tRNA (guanine-N7-)-methyltransferase
VTNLTPASGSNASVIFHLDTILDPLPLEILFPIRQPMEIDLGSGDGSFLVQYAAMRPTRNFIGVERLLGRLRKVERKTTRRQLTNVRLVRIEASYLLEYLIPAHSIAALHVYFPDPWPKRKQTKHRLVNERFPALAARALAPGGMVYLRTDHDDYFSQMTSVFATQPEFALGETPADLAALLTDFEVDFVGRGISTLRAAYQRRSIHSESAGSEPATPQPSMPT